MFKKKTQSALARDSLAIGALVTLAFSAVAFAGPPHQPDLINTGNLWEMTTYDDKDPNHVQLVTQGICFENAVINTGTHQRLRWCSTTVQGWKGWAQQEGDQVFMHGNYIPMPSPIPPPETIGSTALQWEIVTEAIDEGTKGFGHCVDWHKIVPDVLNTYGYTKVFANVKFIRVGECDFDADCLNGPPKRKACVQVGHSEPPVNEVPVEPVGGPIDGGK